MHDTTVEPGWLRRYTEIEPFRAVCCHPDCEAQVADNPRVPMCWSHLIAAWREVNRTVSEHAREAPGWWRSAAYTGEFRRSRWERERAATGWVYFIRFGDRIKIGFSTNPSRRLLGLPHDEVLAIIEGSRADESRCHALFDHLRVNGEWFRIEPDLLAFITEADGRAVIA